MRLRDKISSILGWEPKEPTADVRTLSEGIDSYFDGLLFAGIPREQAVWVEAEREKAHRALAGVVMSEGIGEGWERLKSRGRL
jgi:hypothetical protein